MTHAMSVRTLFAAAAIFLALAPGGTLWSQTPGGPATPQQIVAAMKSPMRLEFVQTPLSQILVITTPKEVKYWGGPLAAAAGAVAGQPPPAEKLIAETLEGVTEFEFVQTPLTDVVAFLQDRHGIPIVIDRRALDEADISAETPITRTAKNLPLGSTLELMLDEFNLASVVKYEVLLITTQKRAGVKGQDPVRPGVRDPEPAAAAFRIWKDRTGTFSMEAEFVGVTDGKVQLRKKDGSTVAVPLERLSTEDRQWVRRQR